MTQKLLNILINQVYNKGPKKNYLTNKTDFYHIDDIGSLDTLDLKDYGTENNRNYRYVLVIIDNFSKYGWTVSLKNKNAQSITISSGNNLISSNIKQRLVETERGKKIYNSFSKFLK